MEVSKVTEVDGKNCAHVIELLTLTSRLLDALRLAGLPVSGPGVTHKEEAKAWMVSLAGRMAADLRAQEAAKPAAVGKVIPPQKLTSSKRGRKKAQ